MSSVELFQKGEPVMYLLLLCSLTLAAIAIEQYVLIFILIYILGKEMFS